MKRCNKNNGLEVRHKRKDGGNDLSNAEVLCESCRAYTLIYDTPGPSPAPFPDSVKRQAKARSCYRCECKRNTCADH